MHFCVAWILQHVVNANRLPSLQGITAKCGIAVDGKVFEQLSKVCWHGRSSATAEGSRCLVKKIDTAAPVRENFFQSCAQIVERFLQRVICCLHSKSLLFDPQKISRLLFPVGQTQGSDHSSRSPVRQRLNRPSVRHEPSPGIATYMEPMFNVIFIGVPACQIYCSTYAVVSIVRVDEFGVLIRNCGESILTESPELTAGRISRHEMIDERHFPASDPRCTDGQAVQLTNLRKLIFQFANSLCLADHVAGQHSR